jgi:hypothetical protein
MANIVTISVGENLLAFFRHRRGDEGYQYDVMYAIGASELCQQEGIVHGSHGSFHYQKAKLPAASLCNALLHSNPVTLLMIAVQGTGETDICRLRVQNDVHV